MIYTFTPLTDIIVYSAIKRKDFSNKRETALELLAMTQRIAVSNPFSILYISTRKYTSF